MATFFGLDIGTSFLKAAILDLDALELRHTERVPFPGFIEGLPATHREVHPLAILARVEELLTRLLALSPRCDGLVLCGQMHGFVLMDQRGHPLSNYISWLDQRVTPEEFTSISARLTAADVRDIGNEFRPSIAAPILASLACRSQLPAAPATPVSIADFVAARLCNSHPILDPTQAAAFGVLDLSALNWHSAVIAKLGLEQLNWPPVQSGEQIGMWRGVPCYATIGDQQCALAGALLEDNELSINIGTGSQVASLTANPLSESLQTRPYFHRKFIRTITHIPAGRALSALIRLLTELGEVAEEQAWDRIETALQDTPATDLRAGVAFFPGPCGSRGFLENLHENNLTIGNVFRAVFESMAANYTECARRLDTWETLQRCVFSGGVARRVPLIRDLTSNALQLPYRLSPHPEDTLYGLLVLARSL